MRLTIAAINDLGAIVGTYHDSYFPRTHGFLLDANGFTTLDVPGKEATAATAINNRGHVAGSYVECLLCQIEGKHVGFVYDGKTYSLIRFPGAKETYVEGMNDLGQIVGHYLDASNTRHGFLATPVPEPSTIVLSTLAGQSRQAPHGARSQKIGNPVFLPFLRTLRG